MTHSCDEDSIRAPLYVALWLDNLTEATSDWSAEEFGAYMRLLIRQAKRDTIPADMTRLARIAGMDRTSFEGIWRALLRAKFNEDADDPGVLRNSRMAHERDRALAFMDRQKANGSKGGRPPRKPMGSATGSAMGEPVGEARENPTQTKIKGANAPRGARKNGKAELAAAIAAWEGLHGPMRSDLIDAMEGYRAKRVKRRHPVWDADDWAENLEAGQGDQECLIVALKDAARSGWQSIHPKPGASKAKTTAESNRDMFRDIRQRIRDKEARRDA